MFQYSRAFLLCENWNKASVPAMVFTALASCRSSEIHLMFEVTLCVDTGADKVLASVAMQHVCSTWDCEIWLGFPCRPARAIILLFASFKSLLPTVCFKPLVPGIVKIQVYYEFIRSRSSEKENKTIFSYCTEESSYKRRFTSTTETTIKKTDCSLARFIENPHSPPIKRRTRQENIHNTRVQTGFRNMLKDYGLHAFLLPARIRGKFATTSVQILQHRSASYPDFVVRGKISFGSFLSSPINWRKLLAILQCLPSLFGSERSELNVGTGGQKGRKRGTWKVSVWLCRPKRDGKWFEWCLLAGWEIEWIRDEGWAFFWQELLENFPSSQRKLS